MIPLTYGTLPEREAFEAAFARECDGDEEPHRMRYLGLGGPHAATYQIAHGSPSKPGEIRPADGDYTASELWEEIGTLVETGQDSALEWASSILSTLGFEWI